MTGIRSGLAGRLAVVVAALLLLAGCPSEPGEDPDTRSASVYRAVISDMVTRYPVDTEDPEQLPTLFVEAFDPTGIPLKVQVDLVTSFELTLDVRFIDDRIEAIDIEQPGSPVRIESILVGLGSIAGDDTVDVRAELYVAETDIRAYRYTLEEGTQDEWSVVDEPEEIDSEGFGATP